MHIFRVHGLDHALRVVRFEGTEGLSELFAFTLAKGTGPIQVEGKRLDVKSDGDVSVQASGKVKVNGSDVEMN